MISRSFGPGEEVRCPGPGRRQRTCHAFHGTVGSETTVTVTVNAARRGVAPYTNRQCYECKQMLLIESRASAAGAA